MKTNPKTKQTFLTLLAHHERHRARTVSLYANTSNAIARREWIGPVRLHVETGKLVSSRQSGMEVAENGTLSWIGVRPSGFLLRANAAPGAKVS